MFMNLIRMLCCKVQPIKLFNARRNRHKIKILSVEMPVSKRRIQNHWAKLKRIKQQHPLVESTYLDLRQLFRDSDWHFSVKFNRFFELWYLSCRSQMCEGVDYRFAPSQVNGILPSQRWGEDGVQRAEIFWSCTTRVHSRSFGSGRWRLLALLCSGFGVASLVVLNLNDIE